MPARLISLMLLIMIFYGTHAQSGDTLSRSRSDVFHFVEGSATIFTAPIHRPKRFFTRAGFTIVGTALLMTVDEPVREFWQNQDNPFLDRLERVGYHYGKPYSAFTFTGVTYLSGAVTKNEWLKETGLTLGIGLFTSGMLQTGLKTFVGRSRPIEQGGAFAYNMFSDSPGYHSFPSGHVAVATSISYIIARRSKSLSVKIVFYGLAGITAFSRMYTDAHWISDVAFGSVLAIGCSELAIQYVDKIRKHKNQQTKLNFTPALNGFQLTYHLQ